MREGPVDSGGIQATGDYPGAARSGDEIRQYFEMAPQLIPGALRFNLHAMYAGIKRYEETVLAEREQ